MLKPSFNIAIFLTVVFVCFACVIICNSQISDPVPKGFDWCDPDLCVSGKPEHIACNNNQVNTSMLFRREHFQANIFSKQKFAPTCVNPQFKPINAACQQAILDAHNKYRSIVASGKVASTWPKASQMALMQYDTMLASLSSLNCMTCVFAHDKCR